MAILLAVFLWNVDVDEVADALERANLKLIAAAIGVALATYWFRAVRWQLILRPAGRVRHSSAVLATAVGYAAMTLLPARMGDLVRPIVLARRERLAVSASLASILTERIFDLWTVVLYFLVFVIWPPQMAYLDETARRNFEILQISGYVVGTGLVLGTLVLLGLFRFQERFVELATRPVALVSSRWRQPVANFLNHFLDGLRVLQRPRDLLVAIGASLLLWYAIYWQVKLTLSAFGLDLPLRVAYFLVTMAVIGLAIPTPGGVGGFHKATQIGLTAFFGVGLNQATAVAIVYHAICFLPITVIGLLCLPLVGVRLREVDSLASEASEP
jgi:uncharacterized protein (TIRG00374 family)